ncbi:hypothetical protein MUG94_16640 [Arthrobacter gengyunqii]|uniref:Uncharacterized protein n=1 Tax=Arthrobacter gengyunqii TaxID=2886940 RepID=A0A9X1M0N6_9MICC|nr:hypothetical protein [Arthrobacter gengyunqii]MCC3268742.1 hypothetical protein [Arthrobacter gengyunqii]UOY96126.1 hypothetical protein MUG94_16640 [Arthrobacter gengyunqii]
MGEENLPAEKSRIALGNLALIKGWFVATALWLGAVTVVYLLTSLDPFAARSEQASDINALGFWLMLMIWGGAGALLLGGPLAVVLGLLLRPVRRQWIHVAVFFAAPAAILWPWSEFSTDLPVLAFILSVGAAAALGRFSVRGDVEVVCAGRPARHRR